MGTLLSLEVSCQAAHPEIVNSVDRHFLKFIEVLMAENYRVVYFDLKKLEETHKTISKSCASISNCIRTDYKKLGMSEKKISRYVGKENIDFHLE